MRPAYVATRLVHLFLTTIGAVTLVFVIIRLAPGDPIQYLMGQSGEAQDPVFAQQLREHYGLDRPVYYQYYKYLLNGLRGDLGLSIHSNVPVVRTILSQLGATVLLAISAIAFALALGVPSGVLAAIRRNSPVDYTLMTAAVIGVSAPPFWLGILLLYFFGYRLPLFPMFGGGTGSLPSMLSYLVLPSIAVGARSLALFARISRSAMLEVMRQDYMRTARAKGLPEGLIVGRHGLGNAALSIITVVGIDTAYLLGGAVTIEMVFSRPGIGRLMVEAIFSRDYPLVQGCILFFAAGVVLVNLLTDVIYSLADPRVEYD